ncbi:MAG: aspartate aminotransferase family protein [Pseudomonadota bacterium]
MNTIEIENTLGLSFSERLELAFTHGKGSYVWDEAGKEYLDFTSGWGVTCLGHSHSVITKAISEQAHKLMQSPNAGFTYSPARAALLTQLDKVLPANLRKTFFCSSGAEANDAALKLARKCTGRTKVISTKGAFHGRTFNTLSVSRGTDNTGRYVPVMPSTCFIPYGDISALEAKIDDSCAAVIVEPIQGEGGVQIPPADYLGRVQALCNTHGAFFIVDEVQTGFCRTGKFFALQHEAAEIQPDILTMGKGIAGGFPFAAFAVSAQVADRFSKDDHGGTYCGNPLGCAVATAVVGFLAEHDVAQRVETSGAYLFEQLQNLLVNYPTLIRQVRGRGLLCAIEFHDSTITRAFTLRCAEHGLLVVPTRNGIVRLLPDLLVARTDIKKAAEILAVVCRGM